VRKLSKLCSRPIISAVLVALPLMWPQQVSYSVWASDSKRRAVVSDPAAGVCTDAKQALAQGDSASAEKLFRQAVKAYPQSALAYAEFANFLLSQGRPFAALEQVDQVLATMPPDTMPATAWLVGAKVYHRTGHLKKCLNCYNAYLKAAPESDEKEQYAALAGVVRGLVQVAAKKPNAYAVTVSGASDYFSDAVSDGFFRWPLKRFPLRILIRPGFNLKSYKPEYEEALRQAVDDWRKATGNSPGLVFVESDNADIIVDFVDDLHAPALRAEAGKTQLTGKMEGVDKASILLLTLSPFPDQVMNRDFMRMIAVHEVGHALGLVGHSPYEDDVMFPSLSAQRGITTRDVATLKRLYDFGAAEAGTAGSAEAGLQFAAMLAALPLKGKVQVLFAEAAKARANNDSSRAIDLFGQILKLDPANKNGIAFIANELNDMGLASKEDEVKALRFFRWASYFDPAQEIYQKNIFASLFNMQLAADSAAVRLQQAEKCQAAGDFRGAIVEYKAVLKLKSDALISAKIAAITGKAAEQKLDN